jgi:single-strand DNA-binding protein
MASYNKVLLMGNLTRDPELRYTPKGTAVLEIGLAINRRYQVENETKEEVVFVDITFWGRQAETINQYCKKGRPLFVEGRLQLDTWDDRQTGQKKSRLRVVGENFQFIGGPRESGEGEPASRAQPSRAAAGSAGASATEQSSSGFEDDSDAMPF